MKKYVSPLLMLVLATFVMAPGWAQAGSGFYSAVTLASMSPLGSDTTGAATTVPACAMSTLIHAMLRSMAFWGMTNVWARILVKVTIGIRFDRATGILAGAAVGYSFAGQNPNSSLGGLRVELEYFYRQSNYDQNQLPCWW